MLSKTIDWGRFFGAAAIFYYHIGLNEPYPLALYGEFAVTFFILAAGVSYGCFSKAAPTDWPSYRHYLAVRMAAIYPIFAVVNLAIFVGSYLYPSALGRPYTGWELVASMTGLSQYVGARYLSQVMWFVPFIAQAYLLFPVIDRVVKRRPPWMVMLASFGLSAAASGLAFAFAPSPRAAMAWCRDWSPLFRLPEVVLGVIVGRNLQGQGRRSAAVEAVVVFAVFSSIGAVIGAQLSPALTAQRYILCLPWLGLIVAVLLVGAALMAGFLPDRAVGPKATRVLGLASYPFFLVHGAAILFIQHRFGSSWLVWAAYFGLCWIGSISLALGVRRWHERQRRKAIAA